MEWPHAHRIRTESETEHFEVKSCWTGTQYICRFTHILLLNDLGVELEVDVLDPLEVDPAHVAGGGVLGLEQLLPLLEDGHHLRLVLQPVHVLVAVSVAALQHLVGGGREEIQYKPLIN